MKKLLMVSLFALAAFAGQAETWKLENSDIAIEVFSDGGSFAATDKRTGRTWKPCASEKSIFNVRKAEVGDNRLSLDVVHNDSQQALRVEYALSGEEVDVTIDGDKAWKIGKDGLSFPAALETGPEDVLIAPLAEGARLPFAEYHRWRNPCAAFGGSLCMPFFGVEDESNSSGWVAILMTSDDARMKSVFADGKRVVSVAPQWAASHGALGYARKVKYVFIAKGGYVTMAKRYRRQAIADGFVKTFREKAKTRANVDRLLGAANVWFFGGTNAVVMANELREAGITRFLWSAAGTAETVKELASWPDVLVSRYDVYRDVYHPDLMRAKGWGLRSPDDEIGLNTSAWPKDILWKSANSNDWGRAWPVTGKDGKKVYCATQCALCAAKRVRRNVRKELKTKPYNARFIDVTTSVGWEECYNPAHPMTRAQCRVAKCDKLRLLGDEFGLVVGSEQGIGAAVPVCDYFEGMLSPWYGRMPHGRPGAGRFDIFRDPLRPTNVTTTELERVEKYATGEKYRIPLFELVYHDCCCAHWYWYDYSNRPLYLWPRRDLLNVLYGTMPMFVFDYRHWRDHKDEFVKSYRLTSPVARRTGYSEMLDHKCLMKDRSVQQSVFADGTRVTVNFGASPFVMSDGFVLGAMSARTEM